MIEELSKPADLSAQKAALLARLLDPRDNEATSLRQISPRNDATLYPLSPGQRRMWLLDQFEKGIHYNENLNLRLKGTISVAVLKSVLQEILRRHEAMRSRFELVDEQLVQRITPVEAIELPVNDLRALPQSSREAEARRLAAEEAHTPFNLSTGPLWRFGLLLIDDRDSLLLITAHHIAVDGWSTIVFRKEFAALYRAFGAGKPSPLPDLALQYADYAAWQTQWLESEAASKQRAYWLRRLSGAPQLLELPADRPRQSAQSFCGARYSVTLPVETATAVKALSAGAGVTLFTTLLAAFATLIKRYTERDDIVVGTPVANRSCSEIEGLIGFFVNTLVLRNDLSGDPTFIELLQRVRGTMLDALANQDLPFEQLVELLHPERTATYNPLVQVLVVLRNMSTSGMEIPELSCSRFEIENGTSKFDLSLFLGDGPEGLSCTFEYKIDLFDAARIERMAEHFRVLLESVVRDPGQRLSELHILTPEERRYLLVEVNNTQAEFPADKCVHQLFEEQAARTPEATAVVFEDSKLSYADLNRRANQLAHHLRTLGVKPDARVAICVERSFEMVEALMAVLKAGGAYVPLDPAYPAERLRFMLQDSAPQALLTQGRLIHQFEGMAETLPILDLNDAQAPWQGLPESNLDPHAVGLNSSHLAYVIYTSGSTGTPKGVAMPHQPLVNLLHWQIRQPNFSRSRQVLQFAALGFDVAFQETASALCSGRTLVLTEDKYRVNPAALLSFVARNQIQQVFIPYAMLSMMAEGAANFTSGFADAGDPAPQEIITAGEQLRITPNILSLFEKLPHCKLQNQYGPTETHVVTSFSLPADISQSPALPPIGRPIANTQIYILDAYGQPTPIGVAGELYIGGVCVARGYLNRPELTAERFVPDPFSSEAGARMYRTGDLARWLADGNIEYLGRNDFQVKIRGFRIELGEIESRLAEHPAVHQAVVIAREDTPGDKRLVGYYTSAEDRHALGAEQLRTYLSAFLPDYMVPAAFVRLQALPLTSNGKLDRKALPLPEADAFSTRGYEPPRGETETRLAEIWGEVLKLDHIGRHDNFFELGGHSLLAVRVIARVRHAMNVEVTIHDLFARPVLSALAEQVVNLRLQQLSPEDLASALAFMHDR